MIYPSIHDLKKVIFNELPDLVDFATSCVILHILHVFLLLITTAVLDPISNPAGDSLDLLNLNKPKITH